MNTYFDLVDILEAELNQVLAGFRSVTDDQWSTLTRLEPLDPSLPHWSVFELAGHFDISIGLTRMLIAAPQEGQIGRDRVSFFIFPRSEVAPVVYDYAYTMVDGKQPSDMVGVLETTFGETIKESRATSPNTVGSGYYALMRLDDFVQTRVVEGVVHGLDLTDALGLDPAATSDGISITAEILDELLARRTVAGRPPDLTDDLTWIRAASGRGLDHPDPRLPLIG